MQVFVLNYYVRTLIGILFQVRNSILMFIYILESTFRQDVMLFLVSWNFGTLVVVKGVNLLSMGVSYVTISLFSTVLSYAGLHFWTTLSPEKLILDGLVSQSFVHSENVDQALKSLLDSYTSIALVANFTINIFVLAILSLKVINHLL